MPGVTQMFDEINVIVGDCSLKNATALPATTVTVTKTAAISTVTAKPSSCSHTATSHKKGILWGESFIDFTMGLILNVTMYCAAIPSWLIVVGVGGAAVIVPLYWLGTVAGNKWWMRHGNSRQSVEHQNYYDDS